MQEFLRKLLLVVVLCCVVAQVVGESKKEAAECHNGCRDGLVCLNATCSHCTDNSQCGPQAICGKTRYEGELISVCRHQPLADSFSAVDLLAFAIFIIAAAISAGGGVGGGGIFVPILILMTRFTPKEAIPLSNTLVSGASVANFVQNFSKQHPFVRGRTLIDYTVALLIEPQTLGGTVIGVYLHEIFPSWLVLLLLIIVMSLTTFRTLKKGLSLYKAECKADTISKTEMSGEHAPLIESKNVNDDEEGATQQKASLGASLMCNEPRPRLKIAWLKILALVFILVVSTVLSVLKGGGDSDAASPIGIKNCSVYYWLISFAIFPLIFIIWGYYGVHVVKKTNKRKRQGLPPVQGDCAWTAKRVFVIGVVSTLAGVMASLLGVGGGLIKGPVLLELGISAEVTAATSSYMILFTSISSSIQYAVLGKLPWDYGVALFVLGLLASFLGQTVLNWLVAKYKRRSYIIFVIAFVIGISALLLIVTEGVTFFETGGNNHFSWIC